MKRIMTCGTWDILHYGHIRLLRRAKELGDWLLVGCSSDEYAQARGKTTFYNYDVRTELLRSIRFVDEVALEDGLPKSLLHHIDLAKRFNIDTFVIGDDHKVLEQYDGYDEFSKLVKIVFLKRTPDISTTQVKEYLTEYSS